MISVQPKGNRSFPGNCLENYTQRYEFHIRRFTGDTDLCISELWNNGVHVFSESQTVIVNISKAFDPDSPKGLVSKFISFGINYTLINWVDNFLKKISNQIVLDGFSSNEFQTNDVVPQSSCLTHK